MNKKRIILLVFVLLLIGGGVFLWQKEEEIKGSPDDYIIEEKEQGRIVKNEKAGFSIEVPEGWEVEKIEVEEGSIVFYSPDAKGVRAGRVKPPLEEGCLIEVAVVYGDMSLEEVKEEVIRIQDEPTIEKSIFNKIFLSQIPTLENKFEDKILERGRALYFHKKGKIYAVGSFFSPEKEQECSEIQDSLLSFTSSN
jgi:hypothetical protein